LAARLQMSFYIAAQLEHSSSPSARVGGGGGGAIRSNERTTRPRLICFTRSVLHVRCVCMHKTGKGTTCGSPKPYMYLHPRAEFLASVQRHPPPPTTRHPPRRFRHEQQHNPYSARRRQKQKKKKKKKKKNNNSNSNNNKTSPCRPRAPSTASSCASYRRSRRNGRACTRVCASGSAAPAPTPPCRRSTPSSCSSTCSASASTSRCWSATIPVWPATSTSPSTRGSRRGGSAWTCRRHSGPATTSRERRTGGVGAERGGGVLEQMYLRYITYSAYSALCVPRRWSLAAPIITRPSACPPDITPQRTTLPLPVGRRGAARRRGHAPLPSIRSPAIGGAPDAIVATGPRCIAKRPAAAAAAWNEVMILHRLRLFATAPHTLAALRGG